MPAYDDLKREDLILRDLLALDRTALAYERTALGYVRTAAAAFLGGVTLIKLVDDPTLIAVGLTLVVAGPLTSAYGLWRVFRRHRRIKHLMPDPS